MGQIQAMRMEQTSMIDEPIGACTLCRAPIYQGKPRRGILRWLPCVVRTCVCYDAILGSIQYALVTGVPMPGAMAMMPRRESEKR
jgi:hypothetical protein